MFRLNLDVTSCKFSCEDASGNVVQTKNGEGAYSGIELSGMNGWSLGGSGNQLTFRHLFYGVKLTNCSVNFNNCIFDDMKRYSYTYSTQRPAYYTWGYEGYGIYARKSNVSGQSVNINNCTFNNSGTGVMLTGGISSEIQYSNFDSCRWGSITIQNPSAIDIIIHHNSVTNFFNGISIYEAKAANSILIENNTLNTAADLNASPMAYDAVNWGVKMTNRLPNVTNAIVRQNQMLNQRKGVYLNGCQQVQVLSNTIELKGPHYSSNQYGIWAVNSAQIKIEMDSIVSDTGITSPTLARGIRFESSTSCRINNNYMLNLSSGINALNFCDLSTLCGNDVWNAVRGWDVFNITLPQQGATNSPEDNMWRNIPLVNRTIGSVAGAAIPFYHRYTQNDPTNKFSPGNNSILVQGFSNITGASPCNTPDTLPQMFSEVTNAVIKDSIVFQQYHEENKWFGEKFAFRLLSKDSMLMNQGLPTDPERAVFFNTLSTRNIGKLDEIEEALNQDNYLQAVSNLLTIVPENAIEENLVTVYSKMENAAKGLLSADDSLTLEEISAQLAYQGGPAVFMARAILDEEYDDELIGSLLRESFENTSIIQSDLYPNPSTGAITIKKILSDYHQCEMSVFDINGCELKKHLLDINQQEVQEDLSSLVSGNYFIRIYCDSQLLKTYKLIIQK